MTTLVLSKSSEENTDSEEELSTSTNNEMDLSDISESEMNALMKKS